MNFNLILLHIAQLLACGGLSVILVQWFVRDIRKAGSEPDALDLLVAKHAPAWFRQLYFFPLYLDEALIVALMAALLVAGLIGNMVN